MDEKLKREREEVSFLKRQVSRPGSLRELSGGEGSTSHRELAASGWNYATRSSGGGAVAPSGFEDAAAMSKLSLVEEESENEERVNHLLYGKDQQFAPMVNEDLLCMLQCQSAAIEDLLQMKKRR